MHFCEQSVSGQTLSKNLAKERNSLPVPTPQGGAATAAQSGYANATEKKSENRASLRKRVSRFSPRQTRRSCAESSKVSVVNFVEAEPAKPKKQKKRKRDKKQADKENQSVPKRQTRKDKLAKKIDDMIAFENLELSKQNTGSAQIEFGSSNSKNCKG